MLAGFELLDAGADVDVDHDLRLAMAEVRAGGAAVVMHADARGDAHRGVVAGIDDGHDERAAERIEHVAHGGGACLRRVAETPPVARHPPSDLEIAGGAEGLDARDTDDAA